MILDIKTILVLFVLNNLLIAGLLGVSFWGRRTRATNLWIASLIIQALTWILFAAQGKITPLMSVVLATTMLSLSWAMLMDAFCEFFEFRIKRYWIYLPPLITLLVMFWNLDNLANRNIAGGLIFSTQFLAAAWLFFSRTDKRKGLRVFIGITAVVMSVMYLMRGIMAFRDPNSIPLLSVSSPFQTATFLIGDAARLAFSFGFLLLFEARRSEELVRLASIDSLTGAFNRRTFMEMAERELARAKRSGQPLGLMFLDVDHFKAVNDTYGHLSGDLVLREFKLVAERCLRQQDVLGRYGGEEFCVLLPDTDHAGAQVLAERMRQDIEKTMLCLPGGETLRITVSIGVSTIARGLDAVTIDKLIESADCAVYQAKQQGRNRVVAEEIVVPNFLPLT